MQMFTTQHLNNKLRNYNYMLILFYNNFIIIDSYIYHDRYANINCGILFECLIQMLFFHLVIHMVCEIGNLERGN